MTGKMMIGKNENLFENKNYKVVIATDEKDGVRYYQVVNKETGVIENGDNVLPKAISFAISADDALIKIKKQAGVKEGNVNLALPPSLQ